MPEGTIGVTAMSGDAAGALATIQDLERRGVPAAWLTSGGGGGDSLTLFAAAAATTERVLLGSCIVTTWPRHPVIVAQQAQVIANLSGGRFRLGVGPGHAQGMSNTYGADYRTPLTNLREYITIAKTLLTTGAVEFEGSMYRANAKIAAPSQGVSVMSSALRPRSFELCGEVADGAISWVCPRRVPTGHCPPGDAARRGEGRPSGAAVDRPHPRVRPRRRGRGPRRRTRATLELPAFAVLSAHVRRVRFPGGGRARDVERGNARRRGDLGQRGAGGRAHRGAVRLGHGGTDRARPSRPGATGTARESARSNCWRRSPLRVESGLAHTYHRLAAGGYSQARDTGRKSWQPRERSS